MATPVMNNGHETDELTREQARALADSKWWEGLDCRTVAEFQLFTKRLCMPFGEFHGAVERALGRPVWSSEFGHREAVEQMKQELLGHRPKPSFADVMNLIPEGKRIILFVPKAGQKEDRHV